MGWYSEVIIKFEKNYKHARIFCIKLNFQNQKINFVSIIIFIIFIVKKYALPFSQPRTFSRKQILLLWFSWELAGCFGDRRMNRVVVGFSGTLFRRTVCPLLSFDLVQINWNPIKKIIWNKSIRNNYFKHYHTHNLYNTTSNGIWSIKCDWLINGELLNGYMPSTLPYCIIDNRSI